MGFLILTRKDNEKIVFFNEIDGSEIELTIFEIDNKRVKIGIDAPSNYTVLRGELRDNLDQDKINKIKNKLNKKENK